MFRHSLESVIKSSCPYDQPCYIAMQGIERDTLVLTAESLEDGSPVHMRRKLEKESLQTFVCRVNGVIESMCDASLVLDSGDLSGVLRLRRRSQERNEHQLFNIVQRNREMYSIESATRDRVTGRVRCLTVDPNYIERLVESPFTLPLIKVFVSELLPCFEQVFSLHPSRSGRLKRSLSGGLESQLGHTEPAVVDSTMCFIDTTRGGWRITADSTMRHGDVVYVRKMKRTFRSIPDQQQWLLMSNGVIALKSNPHLVLDAGPCTAYSKVRLSSALPDSPTSISQQWIVARKSHGRVLIHPMGNRDLALDFQALEEIESSRMSESWSLMQYFSAIHEKQYTSELYSSLSSSSSSLTITMTLPALPSSSATKTAELTLLPLEEVRHEWKLQEE